MLQKYTFFCNSPLNHVIFPTKNKSQPQPAFSQNFQLNSPARGVFIPIPPILFTTYYLMNKTNRKRVIILFVILIPCLLLLATVYIALKINRSIQAEMTVTMFTSYDDKAKLTLVQKPQPFTLADKFEIIQVLDNGALARAEDQGDLFRLFSAPIVYLLADGQNLFYDRQVIVVPMGKPIMQVRTYQYKSMKGERTTVPAIKF